MANKLFEYRDPSYSNLVVEHSGNGKDLYMKGIFVQAETKNQNQRVYPIGEISKAVTSIQEKISKGTSILGELDHPEELSINLDRVSHVITEMWMEGNDGYGKLKILSTPCGEIARSLLNSGVVLGVSSRGSGNVNHSGAVSDYEMITVDIVAQPSAPDAFPKPIYESLFNMRGGAMVHRIAEDVAYTGSKTSQRHLQTEIVKFIQELRK